MKFLQTFGSHQSTLMGWTPIASGPIICCDEGRQRDESKVEVERECEREDEAERGQVGGAYFEQLALHLCHPTHGCGRCVWFGWMDGERECRSERESV
jgi:hypothetical protein